MIRTDISISEQKTLMQAEVQQIADSIQSQIQWEETNPPKVLIVLGSGLNDFASELESPQILQYNQIDGFPPSTVEGHAGMLLYGKLDGEPVLCMKGRFHFYEGHHPHQVRKVIHAFRVIGVELLLQTNAAGGISFPTGSIMMISDHLNWAGANPLIGLNNDSMGPRFFDMSEAYDAKLRRFVRDFAKKQGTALSEGIYAFYSGPNFETPAEIQALQVLGANAVGMSSVPETIAARHCGMRVLAFSLLTNAAAGLSSEGLSHEHTLSQAALYAASMQGFLKTLVPEVVKQL